MWTRVALYWLPGGPLGDLGADWLGWDPRAGRARPDARVVAPKARRYGLHATIVAPFHMAEGVDPDAVEQAARDCARTCAPAELGLLRVAALGRMVALRPADCDGIARIANGFLHALDPLAADLGPEDLARRGRNLSARQRAYLERWGYAYVLDEYRPHLTLSGGRPEAGLDARAAAHFAPALTQPYRLDQVSLVGEDAEGRFHLITDLPLGTTG
ncbi:DUF1045 domain-containing protein [Roseivivax sp. CAU 1753]